MLISRLPTYLQPRVSLQTEDGAVPQNEDEWKIADLLTESEVITGKS